MKGLSAKARFGLVLASVFLVGLLIGAMYVYATMPSGTIVISQGIYPGAPSYTVWVEDSTYYAKSIYGLIPFSGGTSNVSQLVSDVLDAMIASTAGAERYLGTLHFAKGVYAFDTQVAKTVPVGVTACYGPIIEGEGRYTTRLRAIGAHPVFNFTGSDRFNHFEAITIRSLEISSDAPSRSAGNHALIFVNATFTNIYDCYFYNAYDSAIYMNGMEGDFIHDNGIFGNWGCGIEISGENEVHISSNSISDNSLDGIVINGANYIEIQNNLICSNGRYGIDGYTNKKSTIVGNSIGVNGHDGIVLTVDSDNNTITGNVVFENSNETTNTYDGIRLGDSSYNVVSGNRIFDEGVAPFQRWGIIEEGTSNYNIIVGCSTFNGGATGGIAVVGANTECHNCYNLTSWVT